MKDRTEPTRSACFQPDNYEDLTLFADRETLVERLSKDIESYIRPGAPGQARILVRGHRGVGKSLLTRSALKDLTLELGPLVVTVDAQVCDRGADAYMRQLSADLARETIENATEESLRREAELLARFSETSHVTVRDVHEWTQSLKIEADVNLRFLDWVQLKFGLTRTAGRSRVVEEKYESKVDALMLRDLIQRFVIDCASSKQRVVLFLDNLDQVGYAEREEEVREVLDLARLLLGLTDCVVVANLRSEFVSRDLRKLHSREFPVPGMSASELEIVARRRMGLVGEEQQKALTEARFEELAGVLARWTDNPWGYLTWLAHFDYEPLDFDVRDEKAVRHALRKSYVPIRFYDVQDTKSLDVLATAFRGRRSNYVSLQELRAGGADEGLIGRAQMYAAIVPDSLLNPKRFVLSPCLHFLVDD